MKLVRLLAVVIVPILLTGCLFIPGKFGSTMDIRKDGTFTFAYKGELALQIPDDKRIRELSGDTNKKWNDKMAVCWSDDNTEVDEFGVYEEDAPTPAPVKVKAKRAKFASFAEDTNKPVAVPAPTPKTVPVPAKPADDAAKKAGEAAKKAGEEAAEAVEAEDEVAADVEEVPEPVIRKCTKTEIADLRKGWEEKRQKELDDLMRVQKLVSSVFGLDPTQPDSMQRFAADLQKHAGWRSVVYKGNGLFLVDYYHTGRLDHDFLFPLFPDQQVAIPFVTIKRRADGSALVETPGYALQTNGGLFGSMASIVDERSKFDIGERQPMRNPLTNIDGKFTLTTDGEILTNNTKDGPKAAPTGRALTWEFHSLQDPTPKALIKVN